MATACEVCGSEDCRQVPESNPPDQFPFTKKKDAPPVASAPKRGGRRKRAENRSREPISEDR